MTDALKKTIDILFKAMTAEADGRHFYLMAADHCQDSQAREVFTRLAEEELSHQNYLKAQIETVRRTGKASVDLKLPAQTELKGESPIFSAEFKRRLGDAHFEMSSLSIAVHLEESAMRYYRDSAAQVEDPVLKQVLQDLADWEEGHYRALLRQQDLLKSDYWAASGFSPF